MKHILFLFFALLTAGLFVFLKIDKALLPSFIGSTLTLFLILFYHLYIEKTYSPFVSAYIVFTFLFFIVAPITQLSIMEYTPAPEFPTKFPYRQHLAIKTNYLIILFNLSFFAAYLFFKFFLPKKLQKTIPLSSHKVLPLTILVLLGMTVLIFAASLNFVRDEFARPSWMPSSFSIVTILVWKKVLFLVPFAGIVLAVQYLRKRPRKPINFVTILGSLLCLLVLLLWFKNPLTEKRNALGPIYICLIILALPKLLKSNFKMLGFLFLVMIIAFPLVAVITHTDATFVELIKKPSILFTEANKGGGFIEAFSSLNYDAYANIMATIEYVQSRGLTMGFQALSAFLFFVPRGIWESKPISTGELVGDYLIDQYDFSYSNLSNPLVSEGYINFGIIGVILAAILLAIVTIKFMQWLNSPNPLKKILAYYLAIHFIFLLRGDFANGFSYFAGTVVGVLLIPSMVAFFIKQLLRHQKRWKLLKK